MTKNKIIDEMSRKACESNCSLLTSWEILTKLYQEEKDKKKKEQMRIVLANIDASMCQNFELAGMYKLAIT